MGFSTTINLVNFRALMLTLIRVAGAALMIAILFRWLQLQRAAGRVTEAAWKLIGGSTITTVGPLPDLPRAVEPTFKTLRTTSELLEPARLKLRIRFAFLNATEDTITLDDIHTVIYEKAVPTPPLFDMTYHGDALLLQDNSILKDHRNYSLKPGDRRV
jgi:hypothetical protein